MLRFHWLPSAAIATGIVAIVVLQADRRACAASDPTAPRETPAVGPSAAPVALVRGGAALFRILVRSPQSPPVLFAAEQLALYLKRISGAALGQADAAGSEPQIVIGLRSDLAEGDRKLLPEPAKGWDGYAIRVAADVDGVPRIVLGADEPRAVVYGVYDILERLGCRFAHPALDAADPEDVPRRSDLTLPADAWAVASPMRYRTLAWFEWRNPAKPESIATTPAALAAQIDWAMKARYNVFESAVLELPPASPLMVALRTAKQRGMLLQVPGHNFDQFLPSDARTFAEHPEWFGLKDGKRVPHTIYGAQFCWTNGEAQQRFADAVVRFVHEHPDVDILELSALDGGDRATVCACEACAKHSPTDNVIALLNVVVARLAEEAPRIVVETLGGYEYSEQPPEDVRPDPRLRVFWAHWGRSPAISYSSQEYFRRQQRLDAWARAFDDRLTAFQYYSDHFGNAWLTAPLAFQIEGDRRYLMQLGVDGMLNLVYPDGYWWRSSLNAYLAGRSFYDASIDPFELLRDYAKTYFGPAGELMAAYHDEWAREPELGTRSRGKASPRQRSVLAMQRKKYLFPATALVASQPTHRYRLEKLDGLHRLAETVMDVDLDRHEAEAARRRGELRAARKSLSRARGGLAKAAEIAATLAAADTGLVDREISQTFANRLKVVDDEVKALRQAPAASGALPAAAAAPPDAPPEPD